MRKIFHQIGRFFFLALIIFAFTALTIFCAEKTDVLELAKHEFDLSVEPLPDGRLKLCWQKLPYPCLYKVEMFSETTGIVDGEPKPHLIFQEFTVADFCELPTTAIPLNYRVSAYGMFGKISGPTPMIPNPDYPKPPHPVSIYKYNAENPASLMPFLVWHVVPTAVCYELEILSGLPDREGGVELSKINHLFDTRQIFTNGYQVDLRRWKNLGKVFWRARALGLHHEPIGEFSPAEPLVFGEETPIPDRPLINDFDLMPGFSMPIYPVYEWIPLNTSKKYEVELLVKPPVMEHNTRPTPDRAWHMTVVNTGTCYDEYGRPYAGEYYWRVRAVDDNGNTVGTYSDTVKFVVKKPGRRILAAAFGDSITHGGGAVSYSPVSLEYSYTTFLDFPALNLGRSGDTSRTTLERFSSDVLPFKPKNLLVLTGTNCLRDTEIKAEDVIADIRGIKRNCELAGIRPIFLTLMPINPQNIEYVFQTPTDPAWREKLDKINSYIREQPYHIDLEPYFYDATRTVLDYALSADGLHPDLRGKMLMGEIINEHKNLLVR